MYSSELRFNKTAIHFYAIISLDNDNLFWPGYIVFSIAIFFHVVNAAINWKRRDDTLNISFLENISNTVPSCILKTINCVKTYYLFKGTQYFFLLKKTTSLFHFHFLFDA